MDREYRCRLCNAVFQLKQDLGGHIRKHISGIKVKSREATSSPPAGTNASPHDAVSNLQPRQPENSMKGVPQYFQQLSCIEDSDIFQQLSCIEDLDMNSPPFDAQSPPSKSPSDGRPLSCIEDLDMNSPPLDAQSPPSKSPSDGRPYKEPCACRLSMYKMLVEVQASHSILRDKIDMLENNMYNLFSKQMMKSSPSNMMFFQSEKHFQSTPSLGNRKSKVSRCRPHKDMKKEDKNFRSKKTRFTLSELECVPRLKDINTI